MPNQEFKPGDLVSVWYRASRRHKWRMESSIAILIRRFTNDYGHDGALVQTSNTGVISSGGSGHTGPTSFLFTGVGNWQRKLDKPVLYTSDFSDKF